MSQENVEIVRASWEAWRRGDMDELFEFYDPAVEWDMTLLRAGHGRLPWP
jgi:ketosteroid isomerase-like protein